MESRLKRINAKQVTIPEARIRQTLGKDTQTTTYKNIALNDISQGRIASALIETSAMEASGAKDNALISYGSHEHERLRSAGHGASLRIQSRHRLDTPCQDLRRLLDRERRARRQPGWHHAQGRPSRRPGFHGAPDQGFLERHPRPHHRDGRPTGAFLRGSGAPSARHRRPCRCIPDRLRGSHGHRDDLQGEGFSGAGSHCPDRLYGRHGNPACRCAVGRPRVFRQGQPFQARWRKLHGLFVQANASMASESLGANPSTRSTLQRRAA